MLLVFRFIHRSLEEEDHYRTYGVFPMPPERPATNANLNKSDHHIVQPTHPPPSHMNYYPSHENIIINQSMPPHQSASFTQNSSMPLVSRRRSFGMNDCNFESIIPSKRPHMEDVRSPAMSVQAYNNDTTHQCRFVEQNIPSSNVPNSMAQVQQTPVSAPQTVTSVVISEDVINIYRLYEEHNLLRRRVEINEERLQELRATNTYLLQQNEQLRRQAQCSCTNTIVNPVTLTTASQATPVSKQHSLSSSCEIKCFVSF